MPRDRPKRGKRAWEISGLARLGLFPQLNRPQIFPSSLFALTTYVPQALFESASGPWPECELERGTSRPDPAPKPLVCVHAAPSARRVPPTQPAGAMMPPRSSQDSPRLRAAPPRLRWGGGKAEPLGLVSGLLCVDNGVIRDCGFVTRGGQSGGCVRLIAQDTGGLEHEHRARPKLDSAGSVSMPDI